MPRRIHPLIGKLFGVAISASLFGCEPNGEVASNERPVAPNGAVSQEIEALARALAGDDVRVVRVLDREASRWALGVEHGDSAAASAKPPSGTDGTPPLLLLVLDTQKLTAKWAAGTTRVADAALSAASDAIGFIDDAGRPCVVAGWAPTCASVRALPNGIDVAPNGHLVFAAATGISTHLYELVPGALVPRRLTNGVDHHDRPVFDPEGKRVAFVGTANGLASLFVIDLADGKTRQLTNVGKSLGPAGSPSRLPDDFVPPPLGRSTTRWDASGIHYLSASKAWRVNPTTGTATQEEVH